MKTISTPWGISDHVFEKAGLGKAPFHVVGHSYDPPTGQPGIINGVPNFKCCDYCSTLISDCFWIQSADGKTFKVGCDCVRKTGDRGIIDPVNKQLSKIRNERRHKAEETRIAVAKDLFANNRDRFTSKPHPRAGVSEFFKSKNLADYFDWMFAHAGNAGKIQVSKQIEKEVQK